MTISSSTVLAESLPCPWSIVDDHLCYVFCNVIFNSNMDWVIPLTFTNLTLDHWVMSTRLILTVNQPYSLEEEEQTKPNDVYSKNRNIISFWSGFTAFSHFPYGSGEGFLSGSWDVVKKSVYSESLYTILHTLPCLSGSIISKFSTKNCYSSTDLKNCTWVIT